MSYICKCILGVVLHVLFVKIYTKYFHMRMGIFIKKNTATGIFHVAVFALRGFCDLLFEKVVIDVCFFHSTFRN